MGAATATAARTSVASVYFIVEMYWYQEFGKVLMRQQCLGMRMTTFSADRDAVRYEGCSRRVVMVLYLDVVRGVRQLEHWQQKARPHPTMEMASY